MRSRSTSRMRLRWNGAEEIAVCVTDPTEGDQPRGKQSRKPEGIFYTATSGIWQTVWLEPVPEVCIDGLKITAGRGRAGRCASGWRSTVFPKISGSRPWRPRAARKSPGSSGPANAELVLNLPNPHLWSPDDPFLYDLKVTLKDGNEILDSVSSYFGMRKIALRKDDQGFTRIALNDQFIFEIGTLDQGFWPDGIYTAPTDEALRSTSSF